MKRLLLDTNVVVDFVLDDSPFADQSRELFSAMKNKQFRGCVTASALTDIYYIVRRRRNKQVAEDLIAFLYDNTEVLSVDRKTIGDAIDLKFRDFEDAVQAAAARRQNVDAIVTQNMKDFVGCGLTVYSPEEMLRELKKS